MKKCLIILLLVPILVSSQENNKEKFVEFNIGLAAVDGYDYKYASPGASFLWGHTHQISDNSIFEHQLGFAFPGIVTGKFALGLGSLQKYIAIAVRPWPLTVGPQAKIGNLSLSFEVGTNSELSFDSGLISTIGYRWTIGKNKKKRSSN